MSFILYFTSKVAAYRQGQSHIDFDWEGAQAAQSCKGQYRLRDRSLFMEGGEGNFFFPKFLKLKAPP